jgi:hypothetical protein
MHTTGWNRRTVRHIPEEELHAYLDQALSRSQCVEIERHLARCGSCKRHRDNIAGLRDRTTALLAQIGAPPRMAPSFSELQARAAERRPVVVETPKRWVALSAWAAGIAAAIIMGWQVKSQFGAPEAAAPLAAAPAVLPTAIESVPAEIPIVPVHVAVSNPKPKPQAPARALQLVRSTRPIGDAAPYSGDFANAIETDSVEYQPPAPARQLALTNPTLTLDAMVPQPVSAEPGLEGLWRTIAPSDDNEQESSDIALVPGLPVIQMRQQPAAGKGDLPVTAVDQRLESGELIRTVSGPAQRVLSAVDDEEQVDSSRVTVSIRQGSRMVSVTGPKAAINTLVSQMSMNQAKRRY